MATSYCTQQDLINAFGESELIKLTNFSINASAIDVVTLQDAIEAASAEIDMYLAGRNLLPLPLIPNAIVRMACDITRYYLYRNPSPEAPVSVRYTQRVKQLRDISEGKISFGLDANNEPVEGDNTVQVSPGRNMFQNSGGLW